MEATPTPAVIKFTEISEPLFGESKTSNGKRTAEDDRCALSHKIVREGENGRTRNTNHFTKLGHFVESRRLVQRDH